MSFLKKERSLFKYLLFSFYIPSKRSIEKNLFLGRSESFLKGENTSDKISILQIENILFSKPL